MMSLMIETGAVEPSQQVRLEASGIDLKSLLVAWLYEILYQVEVEGWAFAGFRVSEMSDTNITGYGTGEQLDPERHGAKTEIKAPTYHMLEVGRQDGGWSAQVIFDL